MLNCKYCNKVLNTSAVGMNAHLRHCSAYRKFKGWPPSKSPFTGHEHKGVALRSKQAKEEYINDRKNLTFDELKAKHNPKNLSHRLKDKIRFDQKYRCNKCGRSKWLGKLIVLEVHHKDGNSKNNIGENLEALCPNCHSLTDTWRFRRGGENGKTHKT